MRRLLLAALTCVAPCLASAHPHIFFDSTAAFRVEDGKLTGLRVTYLVDEFNTLYTLSELDVDKDGDGALTTEERKITAAAMAKGMKIYDYFADLQHGGTPVALPEPREISLKLTDGRIDAVFDFDLEPLDLNQETVALALYDRSYFTEVRTMSAPTIQGAPSQCRAIFTPFQMTEELKEAQAVLARLSREEVIEDENVGVLFADKTVLRCSD